MSTNRSGLYNLIPHIIVVVIIATTLALAAALGPRYMANRPAFPPGTYEIYVEGARILVESDPDQEVLLINLP